MSIVNAAGIVADLLSAEVTDPAALDRLLSADTGGAETGAARDAAAAGCAAWAVRELAAFPAGGQALRLLAAAPPGPDRAALAAAELLDRVAADPGFAASLARQAQRVAAAAAPGAGAASTDQSATVHGGGIGLNAGGDLDVSGAQLIGGNDHSRRIEQHGDGATVIGHPVTTVTGPLARVHIGSSVKERKLFLLPAYLRRPANAARSAASAHPAVAAAVCTVVVSALVSSGLALTQSSAPTSPTAGAQSVAATATSAAQSAQSPAVAAPRATVSAEPYVSVKLTGTGQPVVGPDGRIWLAGANGVGDGYSLAAVDPATDAVATYPLTYQDPSGGAVSYPGQAVFDGAGNLWLSAFTTGYQQEIPFLLRFTPHTGAMTPFALPSTCATALDPRFHVSVYRGSDGSVWAVCPASDNSTSAGGVVERFTASGPADGPYGGQLNEDQYLASITETGCFLAPDANGGLMGLALSPPTSLVDVSAAGAISETDQAASSAVGFAAGSGAMGLDMVDDLGTDAFSTQRPGAPAVSIGTVPTADEPGPAPASGISFSAPAVDPSGDIWVLDESLESSKYPYGQLFYDELAPNGTSHAYPVPLPPPGVDQAYTGGPPENPYAPANDPAACETPDSGIAPVVTAGGELWFPVGADDYGIALLGYTPAA